MNIISIVTDIAVIIADIVLIVALLKHKNNPEKQTKSIKEALKKFASKNSTLSDECSIQDFFPQELQNHRFSNAETILKQRI